MPAFCCVVKCSMRGERDNVSFYRFPAVLKNRGECLDALSEERRNAWVKAIKRGPLTEKQLKYWRVCSRHFINGAPAELKNKDHPDWIPNQNMGYVMDRQPDQASVLRHERHSKRRKTLSETEEQTTSTAAGSSEAVVNIHHDESSDVSCTQVHENNSSSTSSQTDLNMDHLNKLFSDLDFCNSQIFTMKKKLDMSDLNEDSFKKNDAKTLYFTGFQNADVFFIILNSLTGLSSHPNRSLKPFQQFLLTMMKLRLNLPFKYLSYRFAVSPTTASETFYKCVDVLYDKYKCFIHWPTREQLQKNIPACFKQLFGNKVAVIIDCFEVFTETPSQMVNASHCWSSYKHHETVKFLIGITPQGTISYISEAWGGRASDKYITENCGFLNFILPGDVILADRGFLVKDSVEMLGAHLKIPAFTKGKTQLHPIELEDTRNIATVRIHIERIIGLLKKKFHIFRETIPISMLSKKRDSLTALDKIVVVTSAFINLSNPQIPLH